MLHSIVYTMCEAQAQSISELKETVRRKTEEAQSFRAKMNEYKLSCTMIEESYKDLDIEFKKLINPSPNRFVIDLDLDQTHFILMSIASYREDLKKMDNTEFKAIQGIYKQIQLRFQFIHSLLEGNNLQTAVNKLEEYPSMPKKRA